MTAEEKIRKQCEAREKYTRDMASATAKGKREGRAEGKEEGRIEGQQQMIELFKRLIADNRYDDIERIEQDENLLQELFKEYNI